MDWSKMWWRRVFKTSKHNIALKVWMSRFTPIIQFIYLLYRFSVLILPSSNFYWPLETGYRDIDITRGTLYRGWTIHLQTWWFPFWVKVSRTQREPLAACGGVGNFDQNFGISLAALLSSVVHIFVSDFLCFKSDSMKVSTICITGAMHQTL